MCILINALACYLACWFDCLFVCWVVCLWAWLFFVSLFVCWTNKRTIKQTSKQSFSSWLFLHSNEMERNAQENCPPNISELGTSWLQFEIQSLVRVASVMETMMRQGELQLASHLLLETATRPWMACLSLQLEMSSATCVLYESKMQRVALRLSLLGCLYVSVLQALTIVRKARNSHQIYIAHWWESFSGVHYLLPKQWQRMCNTKVSTEG